MVFHNVNSRQLRELSFIYTDTTSEYCSEHDIYLLKRITYLLLPKGSLIKRRHSILFINTLLINVIRDLDDDFSITYYCFVCYRFIYTAMRREYHRLLNYVQIRYIKVSILNVYDAYRQNLI